MDVTIELKKIILNPLYLIFFLILTFLTWTSWQTQEASQLDYARSEKDYFQVLYSDLEQLRRSKNKEVSLLAKGAMSDSVLIQSLIDEKKWGEIPFYKVRFYADLSRLQANYPDRFPRISGQEIAEEAAWSNWLLEARLPDTPREKGWSLGKQLEGFFKSYFGFVGIGLLGLFFLFYQVEERKFGYQRLKASLVTSSFDVEMVRFLAKSLGLAVVLISQLLILLYLEYRTESLNWQTLRLPIFFSSSRILVPLWSYFLSFLLIIGLLLMVYQSLLLLLDRLVKAQWLYITLSSALLVLMAYLTEFEGVVNPLAFSHFFQNSDLNWILWSVFGLFLGALFLFAMTYVALSKNDCPLGQAASEELEPKRLASLLGWVHLISWRRQDWSIMARLILAISCLFSLLIGMKKGSYLGEEADSLQMEYSLYQTLDPNTVPASLPGLDALDIEDLKQSVLKHKKVGLAKTHSYFRTPDQLPQAYLDLLAYERERLEKSYDLFEEGGQAGEISLDNLNRLSVRNQVSQFYWEQLRQAGVRPSSRGAYYILEELESSFSLSVREMEQELSDAASWFQLTDRSGIGSLRTVFDSSFIWFLLVIALWFGLDGKAREVESGTWPLYQTQALSQGRLLLVKWWYGLGQSLSYLLGSLLLIFMLNSLFFGMGNLKDGLILFGSSPGQVLLEHFQKQEIWLSFMSNGSYLSCFLLILLISLAILVSLGHFMQLYLTRKSLVYLILVAIFFGCLRQGHPSLAGLHIFRYLYRLLTSLFIT